MALEISWYWKDGCSEEGEIDLDCCWPAQRHGSSGHEAELMGLENGGSEENASKLGVVDISRNAQIDSSAQRSHGGMVKRGGECYRCWNMPASNTARGQAAVIGDPQYSKPFHHELRAEQNTAPPQAPCRGRACRGLNS